MYYKAWDIKNECFAPSSYWYIDPIGILRWADDDSFAGYCLSENKLDDKVQQLILCRNTEIEDIDNNPIFENDLICYEMNGKKQYTLVIWKKGKFQPSLLLNNIKHFKVKVVGNQFEGLDSKYIDELTIG